MLWVATERERVFREIGPKITFTTGGDPRGSCLTFTIPGERGDGWGDGFAVY